MKDRLIGKLVLASMMVFSAVGFIPAAQASHTPVHILHVSGISTFPGQCEYVEARDGAGNIIVDELGIPKPSTLPPTCKTIPNTNPPQIKGCHIVRNTNPVPGSLPSCSGKISAEDSFGVGCIDPMSSIVQCSLRAPTWFYGYCGQTYGGGDAGTFTINGADWTIERMGFVRGRGAWEFSGRMHLATNSGDKRNFRMQLAAAPDKPNQGGGCDVTHDIESIVFAGTMEIYGVGAPMPPKTFRTTVGWHWCDDDFGPPGYPVNTAPFKTGTPGENC
ncbi:MAG: hypothetical protein ABR507_11245 [Actinomycetota bacterium]|nr:hypothetical protein [Actinomycetota bacterium]